MRCTRFASAAGPLSTSDTGWGPVAHRRLPRRLGHLSPLMSTALHHPAAPRRRRLGLRPAGQPGLPVVLGRQPVPLLHHGGAILPCWRGHKLRQLPRQPVHVADHLWHQSVSRVLPGLSHRPSQSFSSACPNSRSACPQPLPSCPCWSIARCSTLHLDAQSHCNAADSQQLHLHLYRHSYGQIKTGPDGTLTFQVSLTGPCPTPEQTAAGQDLAAPIIVEVSNFERNKCEHVAGKGKARAWAGRAGFDMGATDIVLWGLRPGRHDPVLGIGCRTSWVAV